MTRLLILSEDAGAYAEQIGRELPAGIELRAAGDFESARPFLPEAEIILGEPPLLAPALADAKSLRWVQSTFAGVDALMRPGLRRDYLLTGVKGVFGPLMSEYVFGWLLAIERDLFPLHEQQQRRIWASRPYRSLRGLTLGIAGLGSIGSHIASTAKAFGMRVVGLRRSKEEAPGLDRTYATSELKSFLGDCDHVVLVLPATPETHHLIDAEALTAMQPHAILINVGRGSVVDEAALAGALSRRVIAGAVLDVFEREPLPPESPLWSAPGCFVTPHVAAYSFPAEIGALFLENLRRWVEGRPLLHVVHFELGY
jgi:phosphoglycerate dehydrogenase-like enzyme